jgi:signal transduction histidine kinase
MISDGVRWRLTALGLAVALMGAAIVAVTLIVQKLAGEARVRLSQVDVESFRIADHFRDKLRYANDKMRRYATTEQPAAWDEFLAASQEIKGWLQGEETRLSTPAEKQLLQQLHAGLDAYNQRATALHALMQADNEKVGAPLPEYNSFFEQSRHFLDLGQELGRAHFDSRNRIVEHASRNLSLLRLSVLGLVALLFLFGLALTLVVYRDLISPLRIKLVKSEALAERNEKLASLGLLAAGVAHEIRNPLTAIKTALFLQQKKLPTGSAQSHDGEVIEHEIVRLERIVNQFLEFARPAQPEVTSVQAELPLKEVHTLLAPQLAKADIQLVLQPAARLTARMDAAQIKQVLINLVHNAADSIGRGGTITLRARPDRRQLNDGDTNVVVLEVADTGKGIPPEVEKRLFDPFFTTKDKGTGLGLSIAARVVELNGGALQYQTQVNRGTTFGIVLPRGNES